MKPLAVILLALVALSAEARDPAQVRAFRATHACPATGKLGMGACPNFVVDHSLPLCAGGVDAPSNMQWQTVADAKAKDVQERALCARLKVCKP